MLQLLNADEKYGLENYGVCIWVFCCRCCSCCLCYSAARWLLFFSAAFIVWPKVFSCVFGLDFNSELASWWTNRIETHVRSQILWVPLIKHWNFFWCEIVTKILAVLCIFFLAATPPLLHCDVKTDQCNHLAYLNWLSQWLKVKQFWITFGRVNIGIEWVWMAWRLTVTIVFQRNFAPQYSMAGNFFLII